MEGYKLAGILIFTLLVFPAVFSGVYYCRRHRFPCFSNRLAGEVEAVIDLGKTFENDGAPVLAQHKGKGKGKGKERADKPESENLDISRANPDCVVPAPLKAAKPSSRREAGGTRKPDSLTAPGPASARDKTNEKKATIDQDVRAAYEPGPSHRRTPSRDTRRSETSSMRSKESQELDDSISLWREEIYERQRAAAAREGLPPPPRPAPAVDLDDPYGLSRRSSAASDPTRARARAGAGAGGLHRSRTPLGRGLPLAPPSPEQEAGSQDHALRNEEPYDESLWPLSSPGLSSGSEYPSSQTRPDSACPAAPRRNSAEKRVSFEEAESPVKRANTVAGPSRRRRADNYYPPMVEMRGLGNRRPSNAGRRAPRRVATGASQHSRPGSSASATTSVPLPVAPVSAAPSVPLPAVPVRQQSRPGSRASAAAAAPSVPLPATPASHQSRPGSADSAAPSVPLPVAPVRQQSRPSSRTSARSAAGSATGSMNSGVKTFTKEEKQEAQSDPKTAWF